MTKIDSKVDQRIGIFMDTQNLYYSARNIYNGRVNFEKLTEFISEGRQIIRSVAYVVQKQDAKQGNFYGVLKKCGFDVKVKELKITNNDGKVKVKGDWNVGMACDILAIASKLDTVCICSGDNDLEPLVVMLRSHGCRVEIYGFDRSIGSDIRCASDEIRYIPEDCVIKNKEKVEAEEEVDDNVGRLGDTSSGSIDKSALPVDDSW